MLFYPAFIRHEEIVNIRLLFPLQIAISPKNILKDFKNKQERV